METPFRSPLFICVLLLSCGASALHGQTIRSAERRDSLETREGTLTGSWLVVWMESPSPRAAVSLTVASPPGQIYPRGAYLSTTMEAFTWIPFPGDTEVQMEAPMPGGYGLVFNVAGMEAPYHLHVGDSCVPVPLTAPGDPPSTPCQSLGLLSAVRRESAQLYTMAPNGELRTDTVAGSWLVVWVEGRVVGRNRSRNLGVVKLAGAGAAAPLDVRGLAQDSTLQRALFRAPAAGASGGFVPSSGPGLGWWCSTTGAVELHLSGGRTVAGLLFDISRTRPPYRLLIGDSTYAVPLAPRPG